jgi:hypothetical protein
MENHGACGVDFEANRVLNSGHRYLYGFEAFAQGRIFSLPEHDRWHEAEMVEIVPRAATHF